MLRTLPLLAALALALPPAAAPGPAADARIIRRHDRPDSAYVALGRQFPAVGAIGRLGDATLVAPDWAITAAHVARGARGRHPLPTVRFGDEEYGIVELVVHASWRELGPADVALVRLARPVRGITPLALHRGRTEAGRPVTIVGHGASGTGDEPGRQDDGVRRAATNMVDGVDDDGLLLRFDAPPAGTALEGAPGAGDSGGPALLQVDGRWEVAGVSSAGRDGHAGPGSYGAVDRFTRVSSYLPWLDAVLRGEVRGELPRGLSAVAEPLAEPLAEPSPGASADSLPDTPAGRRAAAFVAAMQAGTDDAILAFLRANFADAELAARPAEARLPVFRRLAGELRGTRVLRVRESRPLAVTIELARADGGAPLVIELLCEERAPNKLVDWRRYD